MKLNAIGVTASDMKKSRKFYELLGFKFNDAEADTDHIDTIASGDEARLMIDSEKLATELLGEKPRPSNHSAFALECESAAEVDEIANKVKENGFEVEKGPWDAFWGQRYAVVKDPDGYKIDLYARLKQND